MTESITLRLEILKMARELVINEYIDRRAQDHNLWVAQSDELMRTRGFKLQYPAFPPYPTEADIIAKADSLIRFMAAPIEPPPAIPQTPTAIGETAPIDEVPTKEAEITEIAPVQAGHTVESMPIAIQSVEPETEVSGAPVEAAPVEAPAEAAPVEVQGEPAPVDIAHPEIPMTMMAEIDTHHNKILKIFQSPTDVAPVEAVEAEATPVEDTPSVEAYQNSIMDIFNPVPAKVEVTPQPAPPTGDAAIMKIFQTDVLPTTLVPVETPDPAREYETPKSPISLAASILPSWIMRNNR
jgi:hypothetical protein